MVEILPYSDTYKSGTLSVLKRNFRYLADRTEEQVYKKIEPLITYVWSNDVKLSDVPFKYGAVLADRGEVVGFFGMMYAESISHR